MTDNVLASHVFTSNPTQTTRGEGIINVQVTATSEGVITMGGQTGFMSSDGRFMVSSSEDSDTSDNEVFFGVELFVKLPTSQQDLTGKSFNVFRLLERPLANGGCLEYNNIIITFESNTSAKVTRGTQAGVDYCINTSSGSDFTNAKIDKEVFSDSFSLTMTSVSVGSQGQISMTFPPDTETGGTERIEKMEGFISDDLKLIILRGKTTSSTGSRATSMNIGTLVP